MRKVALVQPLFPRGKSLGIHKAPESIMALAGVLMSLGYDVRMFHAWAGQALQGALEVFNPDFVGISTMTPNYPKGRIIAKRLKKWKPDLPITLGGWHASGCVQAHISGQESETVSELLNLNSPFDYVVAGEGEEALPYLLKCLETDEVVQNGHGVSFFKDGQMYISPPAPRVNDIDHLPWPSWFGLDVDSYRDKRSNELDLSVHFNRSCRFRCGFCSTPVVYGHGVRTVSAHQAIRYIEHILERFHPEVITFTDEDFFAQPRWVEELVELLEERDIAGKYGVSFDTFASINDLHRYRERNQGGFLDRMKAVGFGSFTIGIESFNADVLIRYNKELMVLPTMSREERSTYTGLDSEERERMLVTHYHKRTQEAINFAMEHGILVVGDYMIGNLGETVEDVMVGFEIFKNLDNLLLAYIPAFTPFPGTKVWGDAYSSGLLPRNHDGSINWKRFNASAGALTLVDTLRDELELEFYTSARYQRDMLETIRKCPPPKKKRIKKFFRDRFRYLWKLFRGNQDARDMIKEVANLLK